MMFGYASNESKNYMPLPISIAHALVKKASELRKNGTFLHARPDMKSQVTIDYTNHGHPRIDTILMSIQNDPETNMKEFREFVSEKIMKEVAKEFGLNDDFNILINPTGRFVIGGPAGDTGLTGRKIIVDTYGGSAHHGGGAFSGKDPSKVDRSACYYARYIAKNLVAAGAAARMEVQLAYAIGIPEPVSINISTFKTSRYSDDVILEAIKKVFDPRPGAIIQKFSLNKPKFKYLDTTVYGAFGREELNLPWEELDKVSELKEFFAKKAK